MDESLIAGIYFDDINDYYCKNYVIFNDENNQLSAGICDSSNIDYIKKKYGEGINFYHIEQKSLAPILERSFNKLMTHKSKNHLSEISTLPTAKSINYRKMISGFLILFTTCLFLLTNLFNFINNVIYLAQNILKAILFKRSTVKDLSPQTSVNFKKHDSNLPIYTVFVPLYKEVRKLKSIIKAIDNLNYPKSKLDIKFIIEADDKETIKAMAVLNLPDYIQLVKVPFSLPRTKPKALNYATSYIKGEYLCIYYSGLKILELICSISNFLFSKIIHDFILIKLNLCKIIT